MQGIIAQIQSGYVYQAHVKFKKKHLKTLCHSKDLNSKITMQILGHRKLTLYHGNHKFDIFFN